MIKTFRGLLAHGSEDTIVLHTNDGSTGYRIVKFEVMPNLPGSTYYENVVKIYKISQTSIDGTIDFSDNTLLGVAYNEGDANNIYRDGIIVSFDLEVFNQDIYITNNDATGQNKPVNYYVELEQVKLDLSENTVATLKDIRNVKTQGF
jgi:hypothetical protein